MVLVQVIGSVGMSIQETYQEINKYVSVGNRVLFLKRTERSACRIMNNRVPQNVSK
jgi:hypothetical protein